MITVEIETMPVVERMQLMELLWNSMCSEKPEVLDVPLWHRDILATRLQKLNTGEEHVSDWVEAKKRILTQAEGL